jgi:hypothetical protein
VKHSKIVAVKNQSRKDFVEHFLSTPNADQIDGGMKAIVVAILEQSFDTGFDCGVIVGEEG